LRSEGKPRNGLFAKRLTGLGYIVIEAGPYLYGSEALKTWVCPDIALSGPVGAGKSM